MGCYNCGSSDGTDTKLCPRCAENRARRRANPSAYVEQHRSYQPESKFPQYLIGGVLGVCVTAFIGYNVYKDAQFKALPIHERFYQKCIRKTEQEAAKAERDIKRMQGAGHSINFNWESAPADFSSVARSYEDPAVGFREATLITGKNFCEQTRNRCEVDPVVCKCPILRSRYNY